MLSKKQIILKRIIDVLCTSIALIFFVYIILLLVMVVFLLSGEKGIFTQERIGLHGNVFKIYKIRSIYKNKKLIWLSKFIRKTKLDELPQLWNVLLGDMSIVGPRPDLKGFADELQGKDRIILNLKPGLTGPASLFFYNEEELLNQQVDKEVYNKEVIWKKKVNLNIHYIENYSLLNDIKYILKTLMQVIRL